MRHEDHRREGGYGHPRSAHAPVRAVPDGGRGAVQCGRVQAGTADHRAVHGVGLRAGGVEGGDGAAGVVWGAGPRYQEERGIRDGFAGLEAATALPGDRDELTFGEGERIFRRRSSVHWERPKTAQTEKDGLKRGLV